MSSIEDLFGKLAMTTVTTVSRIALSHATNAAIRNVTSYITTQLPKNKPDTREIRTLQRQLDLKVKNLKPTIDIIARSVADGNQDLEPALEMCNDLKGDIDAFASQVNTITDPEQVKARLKRLLANVDDAIPSLHLSLRSIENKSGKHTVSPAKLVQASSILLGQQQGQFKVKLYSLFAANQRAASAEAFTWKEEYHKCDLVVVNKTKKAREEEKRDYGLIITEDLNDGLYHEEGEGKQQLEIDISHIERMYYTQSGELLNIEDSKSPVLVMKVLKKVENSSEDEKVIEVKETAPEIIKEELQESDWYAIGLSTDEEEDEDDDDDDENDSESTATAVKAVANNKKSAASTDNVSSGTTIDIPMNLLLLESVIKLALLEISEQMNHLNASDELIALYMK